MKKLSAALVSLAFLQFICLGVYGEIHSSSNSEYSKEFNLYTDYGVTIHTGSVIYSQGEEAKLESLKEEIKQLKKNRLYYILGAVGLAGVAGFLFYKFATHEPGERVTQAGETGKKGQKSAGKAFFLGGGLLCVGLGVLCINNTVKSGKAIKEHEEEIKRLEELKQSLAEAQK